MSINVTEASSWGGATPPLASSSAYSSLDLRPSLLTFISDENLALLLPLVVYWCMGLFFQYLNDNDMFPRYRLHTPEELEKKNKCSEREVIRSVFLQHLIQTGAGVVFASLDEPQRTGFEAYEMGVIQSRLQQALPQCLLQLLTNSNTNSNSNSTSGLAWAAWALYYVVEPGMRLLIAFVLIDSWQFFLHMLMHRSKFLYKHLHSVHHRLYVPYAYGALYNSILEGFLLDTLGTGLAQLITGLTPRESIILFTFSTMKTVDDHCGYALPFDPFQIVFPNNAAYHDIHHQHFGIKTNYAQPFFTFWDTLFGTDYKNKKEYLEKQRLIREEKYQKSLKAKAVVGGAGGPGPGGPGGPGGPAIPTVVVAAEKEQSKKEK